jgi:hypothetical protein
VLLDDLEDDDEIEAGADGGALQEAERLHMLAALKKTCWVLFGAARRGGAARYEPQHAPVPHEEARHRASVDRQRGEGVIDANRLAGCQPTSTRTGRRLTQPSHLLRVPQIPSPINAGDRLAFIRTRTAFGKHE